MDVTTMTWAVAVAGLVLIALLGSLQFVAVLKPRTEWTIKNVYGGDPASTDATAYLAFNQGYAWADVFLWAPLQVAGSIGMLLGHRWGFLLALAASVPYVYTAVNFFIWDRDLGFRKPTVGVLGCYLGNVASIWSRPGYLLLLQTAPVIADDVRSGPAFTPS